MVRLRGEDLVTRKLGYILTSDKKWKKFKETRWSLLSLFACMPIFSHVWGSRPRHLANGHSCNLCHDMCSLRYHSHDRSLHGILQYKHLHWCVHVLEQSPVIRLTWYLMVYLQSYIQGAWCVPGFYDHGKISSIAAICTANTSSTPMVQFHGGILLW